MTATAVRGEEIAASVRLGVLERNLEALCARGMDFAGHLESWREHDEPRRWFRRADGNIERMRDGAWEQRGDQITPAASLARRLTGKGGSARPMVIDGIDPPWVLRELARMTAPGADWYSPRLSVVQRDVMELLDGLAYVDLTGVLSDDRVHVFAGEDASRRFAAHLRSRFATQITGPVIPVTSRRALPHVEQVLRQAEHDQKVEHARLRAAIEGRYAGRDRAWWAKRYAAAGADDPVRVLVPTCRYSTFVRHSASDLVRAFEGAGLTAELLIEPDSYSKLSSLAYLRAIERFEPDLIVLINYPRGHAADIFPANVPFVTWVQDAMPHHYDERAGAAAGELDFFAGNVGKDLFAQFGYPRARCMPMPVVASARTFHPEPVSVSVARRHECEIAWVSHHSEEPGAMHARMIAEVGQELAPILETLRPKVERIALRPMRGPAERRLRAATMQCVRDASAGDEERLATRLFHGYAKPLADRILRHQTIQWAAEIADRRGWRLRIHGRGWEKHARLGKYAAGEIAHDDDLRACYQCAGVHLHVSIGSLVHQRVMECALSGGLPLCRLNDESLYALRTELMLSACQSEPIGRRRDSLLLSTQADERTRAICEQIRHCGSWAPGVVWIERDRLDEYRAMKTAPERRAGWLLGDLSQTTFTSAKKLERLVERAMTDEAWRRGLSEAIAGRVRTHLTDDVFAARTLALVREGLGA